MQNFKVEGAMVGAHALFKDVLRLARRIAPSDLAANIVGETGTGKELLARFIHAESSRRCGPFVTVDCGMLNIETARSELFGHAKGAFTGALSAHQGMVAEAAGGTLFLDEVGELDLNLQLQLLRLIQEGTFRRMGDTRFEHVDVRVVTATHCDLETLVHEKKFRADLYYRLQMVPLHLPPLRARRSDIGLLVDHFCKMYSAVDGPKQVTETALNVLVGYDWPGNVRELQHEMARLALMVVGPTIDVSDLAAKIGQTEPVADVYDLAFKAARKVASQNFMRNYLHRKLLQCGGNVTLAAKASGVGRQYFQMRMAECGLRSKVYKQDATLR